MPPNIVDSESSGDVMLQEGANATLSCSATGHPMPSIVWRREDNKNININRTHQGENSRTSTSTEHIMVRTSRTSPSTKHIKVVVEQNTSKHININTTHQVENIQLSTVFRLSSSTTS